MVNQWTEWGTIFSNGHIKWLVSAGTIDCDAEMWLSRGCHVIECPEHICNHAIQERELIVVQTYLSLAVNHSRWKKSHRPNLGRAQSGMLGTPHDPQSSTDPPGGAGRCGSHSSSENQRQVCLI